MKIIKHLKRTWLIYALFVPTLILGICFPDFEITLSGGFAWYLCFVGWLIGSLLIYSGITGAEISYKSNGIIPTIKKWREQRKEFRRERKKYNAR